MLFAITLLYVRPIDEIQAQMAAHKEWLVKYTQSGAILFSGPLSSGNGGIILAYAEAPADVQAMIDEDPFDIHRLAAFDIQGCAPALRAAGFPAQWAPGARPV